MGKKMEQPLIDIILIGVKEGEFSERCIKSIEMTADMPYRIIKSFGGSIAENFNKGLAQTTSEVIGFFQDDWEFFDNNWMSTLYDALIDSGANYVSAKQLLPDKKIHCAWLKFFFPKGKYGVELVGRGKDEDAESEILHEHGVPVFIKRERAIEIGGQDENFKFSQHEEPDFCIRLGRPLYYGRISYIHHFGENPVSNALKKTAIKENLIVLNNKHQNYDEEWTGDLWNKTRRD
jgi:hypothetical protein